MNETSLTTKFVGIKFSFALKAELTYKQFIYYKQTAVFKTLKKKLFMYLTFGISG